MLVDNAKNHSIAKVSLRALGQVGQLTNRPYRPQTTGKAERFNRTLVDEWTHDRPYRPNAERLAALEELLINYNYVRTDSGFSNRPPRADVSEQRCSELQLAQHPAIKSAHHIDV